MDFNYKGLWISFHVLVYFVLYVTCYLFSVGWVPFACLMQGRSFCLLIKHSLSYYCELLYCDQAMTVLGSHITIRQGEE